MHKKTLNTFHIQLINYPNSLQSCIYGLKEMFELSNDLCDSHDFPRSLATSIVDVDTSLAPGESEHADLILFPPSLNKNPNIPKKSPITEWLIRKHQQGAIICSACAGAFYLAAAGLLENRRATTHWAFANLFQSHFPNVELCIDKIVINDGDIITAGGLMSWIDLGLEVVAKVCNPQIMRQLGKQLVIDTGVRHQTYYQIFSPVLNHGDQPILKIQHHLQQHHSKTILVKDLAKLASLSDKTFLRRFSNATGFTPREYLQNLRIQQACELLEGTTTNINTIAYAVGYEDVSAFRKAFIKIMGLTPGNFRERFTHG